MRSSVREEKKGGAGVTHHPLADADVLNGTRRSSFHLRSTCCHALRRAPPGFRRCSYCPTRSVQVVRTYVNVCKHVVNTLALGGVAECALCARMQVCVPRFAGTRSYRDEQSARRPRCTVIRHQSFAGGTSFPGACSARLYRVGMLNYTWQRRGPGAGVTKEESRRTKPGRGSATPELPGDGLYRMSAIPGAGEDNPNPLHAI